MQRVSVVVPVFNGEQYLGECLESALRQECAPWQVIVVDDGSTDGSAAIAGGFGDPVRVLRQPNRGPGAARNAGVAQAEGEFVAFLDADDLWTPGKLSAQLAYFAEDPEVHIVSAHVRNFHSPDLTQEQRMLVECPPDPMPGLIPSAMLVRRETFAKCGLLSEDLAFGDFIPWLARVWDLGLRLHILEEALALRRLHLNNFTRTHREHQRDYLAATKRVLDRRRRLE